jgi:DNA-binding PadR family transcriptional regulator
VARRRPVSNLLGLALLALLVPGDPMHPYQMVTMLRRTGKEQDMKIKWGSLYTVVQNLERHGLIEAVGSSRDGRRPERTLYTITDAGRAEVRDWLRELVAEPEPEPSRFRAALSVLGVLPPAECVELLGRRLAALDADIAAQRTVLVDSAHVGRIFLVEVEYDLAVLEAEARWVRALLTEIDDGSFPGLAQWQAFHDSGRMVPEWQQLMEGAAPEN